MQFSAGQLGDSHSWCGHECAFRGVCRCRKERMDRIKRLRWQQRSLPDSIKINLSPQEIQVHHLPMLVADSDRAEVWS